MHVALISPFFWPEEISTGRYNTFLAEALVAEGATVEVISAHPFYPEWKVQVVDNDRSDIRIARGGRAVRYPRSQLLRRALLELWFAGFVRRALAARQKRVDIVVEVFPPELFSLPIRRVFPDIPRIGIVHDLQGVMMHGKNTAIRRIAGRAVLSVERRALHSCTHLIFLSNQMKQAGIEQYGIEDSDCRVVYPFRTLAPEAGEIGRASVPAIMRGKERTLVYSGALGEKQCPDSLLLLLDRFAASRNDFHVMVFSRGPVFERLREKAHNTESKVIFHDLVPDHELRGLIDSSTVQIIPQATGLSAGAFPSKLPNIINCETAVFAITDSGSDLDRLLRNYSRGASSNSWDLDALMSKLNTFVDYIITTPALLSDEDRILRMKFDPSYLARAILSVGQGG